ncbi:HAD-IIIC family phosphatase [Streptomyces ipomoeae]|uniref:HAD-IIIC family phosphatase n=1 Tax=Streptomyces ipomoeae TaxID=103232 RepID=UPI0011478B35|nr:HAD-IIIC family phosphatase [Streptomyces ipomoeae]MDX2939097.1 HAD-IIIC family phosphatase [Streptomyces ipomoeae]TQE30887.1 HAD-IIIC family phosphatase [Streptomyces ipomoeae]
MSTVSTGVVADAAAMKPGRVKCLVWDLDNTVWDGVLLEGDELTLRPGVAEAIAELDRRGVLQSVASKNEHDAAMAKLTEFGLDGYFLYPQIGWNPKSGSVARIAELLNIGIDSLAFIDDQGFERDEVGFAHPDVLCVDAAELTPTGELLDLPAFNPKFVTDESRRRRSMYQAAAERARQEEEFTGTGEEFLAGLDMVFTIARAGVEDLQRAEELTVRTHQLNSTGRQYSYEDLRELAGSEDHLLLVARLEDRYGTYGTIGLALVEKGRETWVVKLLLMSCRVMSRGVGTVLLNHIMRLARDAGARLEADFVPTDRNRIMYVTYRFAGFTETARGGDAVTLTAPDAEVPAPPGYLRVLVSG